MLVFPWLVFRLIDLLSTIDFLMIKRLELKPRRRKKKRILEKQKLTYLFRPHEVRIPWMFKAYFGVIRVGNPLFLFQVHSPSNYSSDFYTIAICAYSWQKHQTLRSSGISINVYNKILLVLHLRIAILLIFWTSGCDFASSNSEFFGHYCN